MFSVVHIQRCKTIGTVNWSTSQQVYITDQNFALHASDTPRSSPRLTNKTRAHLHRDHGQKDSPKHDIVVVKEGTTQEDTDLELQKLEKVPLFLPILRGSLNIPNTGESDVLDRLDTRQVS